MGRYAEITRAKSRPNVGLVGHSYVSFHCGPAYDIYVGLYLTCPMDNHVVTYGLALKSTKSNMRRYNTVLQNYRRGQRH